MGYDDLRKKTDSYVKEKEDYDVKFEDFSLEAEKLEDVKEDVLKLDSDLISAFGEIENEFATVADGLREEKENLDNQQNELSDTIGKELETLVSAEKRLNVLTGKKYGDGFSKADDKCKEYISQLEKMMEDIVKNSAKRSSVGIGNQGYGVGKNIESNRAATEEDQDRSKAIPEKPLDDYTGAPNSNGLLNNLVNFIKRPHNEAVEKWTSYLDGIGETLKRQYTAKYGQYITPGKLEIPLSETVIYQTKEQFKADGLQDGVLGYNDGHKSRVAVDTGYELQTTIHENLHQLSSNANVSGIVSYENKSWKNVQINEAITEMITQRTLGEQYGKDYSAYSDNRDAMKLIESVMGEETVCKAYFQNKPDLIKNEIDSVLGTGMWDQLSEAFDDCLNDNEFTRKSGRARRDDIVNKYLLASAKNSGGDNKWMDQLL